MSEHTQGRIKAIRWVDGLSALRPEESSGRHFGGAPVVDMVGGSMSHDNARRLAAAWNNAEGMDTQEIEQGMPLVKARDTINAQARALAASIERATKLEALVSERDAMLGKRPCQNGRCNELNAVRALLRDISNDGALDMGDTNTSALGARVRSYLDACDTLEGNKPVEATGCRKCGDILPDGDYCKAPACPLNPSMKGK